MKRLTKISWLMIAFTLLALSACGGGGAAVAPTVDTAQIFTQVASTALAMQTQIALAAAAVTNTPEGFPTPTVINTPEVSPTPEVTNTPRPVTPSAVPLALHIPAPTSVVLSPSVNPRMSVTLIANDLYTYAATIYAGKGLIFRAQVKNTGDVPLQVVANLTVPQDWDVDEDVFSDCPDNLEHKDTCTISWKFTPQVSGQVYLRVYVRGTYTDSSGNTNRITQSPAFIFNVQPPRG